MSRCKSPVTVVVCGLLVAVCLGSGISPAVAADSDREDRWQFYVPITYTSSERIDGEGGTFIDLGSDLGWGFAFGYNFNERLMLGLEITWSQKNYSARIVGDTTPPDIVDINSRLDSSTIAVVGQYNFLDKAFLDSVSRW